MRGCFDLQHTWKSVSHAHPAVVIWVPHTLWTSPAGGKGGWSSLRQRLEPHNHQGLSPSATPGFRFPLSCDQISVQSLCTPSASLGENYKQPLKDVCHQRPVSTSACAMQLLWHAHFRCFLFVPVKACGITSFTSVAVLLRPECPGPECPRTKQGPLFCGFVSAPMSWLL